MTTIGNHNASDCCGAESCQEQHGPNRCTFNLNDSLNYNNVLKGTVVVFAGGTPTPATIPTDASFAFLEESKIIQFHRLTNYWPVRQFQPIIVQDTDRRGGRLTA